MIPMQLNDEQSVIIQELNEHIKNGTFRNGLNSDIVLRICTAFKGHPLFSIRGSGGTRLVIDSPFNDDCILKIAFNHEGVMGNNDEFTAYHAMPNTIKRHLAEPRQRLADGIILEMTYYEPLTEEYELDEYMEELSTILQKISFIHYTDPPYYHSFGVDTDGSLIVLDYGETEKIKQN